MPDWEDFSDFFDPDDFAQKAEIVKGDEVAGEVFGIFETPAEQSELGDFEHREAKFRFVCAADHVKHVARYDALRINGRDYDVLEPPEIEGSGLAYIYLGQPVVKYDAPV